MSDDTPGDGDAEMLVPFTVVQSHGGPFEDKAFQAGYNMGRLEARFLAAEHFGLGLPTVPIERTMLEQIDLLAMHYNITMNEIDIPDDKVDLDHDPRPQWAWIKFDWGTRP